MKLRGERKFLKRMRQAQNIKERKAFNATVDHAVRSMSDVIARSYWKRGLLVGLLVGAFIGASAHALAVALWD